MEMSLSQAIERMKETQGFKQVMLCYKRQNNQHQVRRFAITNPESLDALQQKIQSLQNFELFISQREGDEVIVSGLKFTRNRFIEVSPTELGKKLNMTGLLSQNMSYRSIIANH